MTNSSIVERLRLRGHGRDTFSQHHGLGFQLLCKEAADHIEALKEALREIEELDDQGKCGRIAREALDGRIRWIIHK